MDLEYTMGTEISQMKTNTAQFQRETGSQLENYWLPEEGGGDDG